MAEIINLFKRQKIAELTTQYNSSVSKLNGELTNKIKTINSSNSNAKTKLTTIQLLINAYNNAIKNLRNKLNNDIKNVNNYSGNFPTSFANKKALLIGINYIGTEYALNGCIDDVTRVKTYLETKNFHNFETLTDLTEIKPTRANILNAIKRLLMSSSSGDLLFIHYSGHGSFINDTNNDEMDGKDEAIVTSDMQYITDDEIKSLLRQHSKANTTIVGLFDCCHSGTMFDIKYTYDYLNGKYTENTKDKDCLGNIFIISGCMDDQTSAEAIIDGKPQGALTWAVINKLTENPNCSWKELMCSISNVLKTNQYTQIPQLTSNNLYNLDSKVF